MDSVIPSADSGIDRERLAARLRGLVDATTRYDLVLAVIPLTLALGVLVGRTLFSTTVGVGGGGAVALAATIYALFFDPPQSRPPRGDVSL